MPSEIGLANEWNWAGQEMGYPHLDLNGQYEEGTFAFRIFLWLITV